MVAERRTDVSDVFRPQVATAADNVGCEPPQIPLSKPPKTKRLQAVLLGLDLNPRRSRDTQFARNLSVRCAKNGSFKKIEEWVRRHDQQ
jgi:hypothetical protein